MSEIIQAFGEINGGAQILSFLLIACAFRCVLLIISRLYRATMICVRGWPPNHLDADGDWKPEPKTDV